MASTFAVSRSHLIYGLCLPLAVRLGYFLAEPLESGSIAIVVLVLSVISLALLMRWYLALFFLSGLTALIATVASAIGPKGYFLLNFFPADQAC